MISNMDISAIRLQNVEKIIDARFDGIRGRFAEAIDRYPNYVSTWWADEESDRKRNIGKNIARTIEKKLNLEDGWLDAVHKDMSDLEVDHSKKHQLRLENNNVYKIPVTQTALLDQQQLKLTLLTTIKGQIMLLSTDKKSWAIKLVGTHPNFILNQGWGMVIEPNTPLAVNEYALVTRKNGEILLRVVAYQDDSKLIVTNPMTSEQATLPWSDIEKAEYCYVGIPPSKVIETTED